MSVVDNPIINGPYDRPGRHWRTDDAGGITDELVDERRRSESWRPVPRPRKQRASGQISLELHRTDERREPNDQVDRIRQVVDLWRRRGYPYTTPTTRRLLKYWADPARSNRVLFAQREAAETAIYLAEAAVRDRNAWAMAEVAEHNAVFNQDLPRVALKMATGSGKTVVMAMIIAWQALNEAARRGDRRFSRRFLVVTPGITIRDRLRVLVPSDEGNYYAERDLVPADLWPALRRAQVTITNYHAFLPRATPEARAASSDARALASSRLREDPFTETPAMVVARVLRGLAPAGRGSGGPLVVLNDEAHHCYAPPSPAVVTMTPDAVGAGSAEGAGSQAQLTGADRKEAEQRNRDAGVWFSGLAAIAAQTTVSAVYDLSATPFFLAGSGYREGFIFPWVVSDFSLLDAIEAGIVKIPRIPVADDAEGEAVTYLNLWDAVGDQLPKRVQKGAPLTGRPLPTALQGALRSLYSSYERAFARWEARRADDSLRAGSTPPVFIVVCPNTLVSRWVYDVVAGRSVSVTDGDEEYTVHGDGQLDLFSNAVDGRRLSRPRTILVDSAQLESGDALSADFRAAAAEEIEAFRGEYAARTGRQADDLTDGDLLREVLNTVGKPGRLGEGVRCVISVSMLSEGWDANTVTHVLGVRAFGSQLLCEQVVGRGLRRRSYVTNDAGYFEPEYAEVYGVPFSFIPSDRPVKDPVPGRNAVEVRALAERSAARIAFPCLDGYRIEVPDQRLYADFAAAPRYRVRTSDFPTTTEVAGLIGASDHHDLGSLRDVRVQSVAYKLAQATMPRFTDGDVKDRPWLFPQLAALAKQWLTGCVDYEAGAFPGMLTVGTGLDAAADHLARLLGQVSGGREPTVLPVFAGQERVRSTDGVRFSTSKRVIETDPERCHVDGLVLDGKDGNTWEQIAALVLESLDDVAAYVKNDHLEFAIPYTASGRPHRYLPDFLVRLTPGDDGVERTLIVEVSGGRKDQHLREQKAWTARNLWCPAVNNDGSFGRWGYLEIEDPATTRPSIVAAIATLRGAAPSRGLPAGLDDVFADHRTDDEELLDDVTASR